MTEIRWVCLSDTHFGAENSVLSHVKPGATSVDPNTAGPVLESLVDCLADLTEASKGGCRPTLVLNGDILELALAQDNVAAMVFERFIDLAFAGVQPLFDDTIVYVPGNHDHHLWETARERQYAEYVATVAREAEIEPPWHVTRLFPRAGDPPLEAELLSALVSRRLDRRASVKVVYPNFAVESADKTRVVVFHHGHYVEPLYRLMSLMKASMFPGQVPGQDIWDWEADNFAWIDFFWSTLGRSGSAGEDVGLIYDMLQSESALTKLAGNLGAIIGCRGPAALRPVARPVASWALARLARLLKARERAVPDKLLSDAAQIGLDGYLKGPLLRQLTREKPLGADDGIHFVFGHTHKPFEEVRQIEGYGQAISVVNTGGWVVDTEETVEIQGASVVVVDHDCNVATLRIYNQTDQRDDYAVHLAPVVDQRNNPLHELLQTRLSFAEPPWSTLSSDVAEAIDQRHALLPRIIRSGMALTGV